MTPERWRRVQDLVDGALDRPPKERFPYLKQACGVDTELYREAERVLRSYDLVDTFMEPTDPSMVDDVFEALPVRPLEVGDRVGQYRLRRRLGRGGMGDVFLAERADDEFRRQVAVKVVHRGTHASGVLRRFKSERQILAGLGHPNIARLLDGGSTDDGRPYLVMELVEGVPIDRYCDQHGLSIEERLHLFQKVCGALQYAHQNLVVHRDIKPSNILVTQDGTPKLLDFGIAKLLNPELFPYTVELTGSEFHPMTPQYASPEQLRGQAITTASDVYSLGVLLYKLLTGRLPHFASGFAPGELERVLSSGDPHRPSAAVHGAASDSVSGTGQGLDEVAKARGTQPPQLRRQLLGDLDNIVLMALRKEPHRRYGSVEQLSDDLRRHLQGMPVRARPDTMGYRVRKFVGRNRVGVAAGCVAALLLLIFAVAVSYQAREIRYERDLVALERDKAQRVADFMVELFEVADPSESRGNTITVREVLDRGADKVLSELSDQPEIQATLLMTIGRVYGSLGLFGRAGPLLEEAVTLRRRLYGERSLEVAEILVLTARQRRGMGQLDDSTELLYETLEIRQEILGATHPGLIESLLAIVENQRLLGAQDVSDALLQRAIEIAAGSEATAKELSASTLHQLASLTYQQGDLKRAEVFAVRLLEAMRREGEAEPQFLLLNLHLLGVIRRDLGHLDLAAGHLRESLEVRRKYWPQDPVGIQTLVALSRVYRLQDNPAAARRQVDACRRDGERWLQEEFARSAEMQTLSTMCLVELAEVAALQGDTAALRTAVELAEGAFQGVDPATLSAPGREAWVRTRLLTGEVEAARPLAEDLLRQGWTGFDFVDLCRRHGIEVR